ARVGTGQRADRIVVDDGGRQVDRVMDFQVDAVRRIPGNRVASGRTADVHIDIAARALYTVQGQARASSPLGGGGCPQGARDRVVRDRDGRVGRGREGGTCGLVKDSGAVVAGERVSVGGNGEVAHRQVREAGRILHLNSHLGIAGELAGGDRGVDGVAAS